MKRTIMTCVSHTGDPSVAGSSNGTTQATLEAYAGDLAQQPSSGIHVEDNDSSTSDPPQHSDEGEEAEAPEGTPAASSEVPCVDPSVT